MPMKSMTQQFLINLIAFQLLWPAAVLGAAAGVPELAWCVLVGMLVLLMIADADLKRDLQMLVVGFVACALLEPVWLGSGVIRYIDWTSSWLAPGWIWALWGGFAVSFFYCLNWLQKRPVIAALFGGVGGGASVIMGVRLGAAEAPQGEWLLALCYGGIWAVVVPLFAAVARWLGHSRQAPKHGVIDNG